MRGGNRDKSVCGEPMPEFGKPLQMNEFEIAKKLFLDGVTFLDAFDFAGAEFRFREAARLLPDNSSILTNLSAATLAQKKYSDAIYFARKAVSATPNNIEALLLLSSCFFHEKKFSDLLHVSDQILALQSNNSDACIARGIALSYYERFEEAVDSYDRAIELNPSHDEAHINRGNALCGLARYAEALESYERAISLNVKSSAARFAQGNVLLDLKRYGDAIVAFDKVLVLSPDFAEAWIGKGDAFLATKDHDQALAAYDKALSLKTELGNAWLGRANALVNLKRYQSAVAAYERALDLSSGLSDIEGARLHAKMVICDWDSFDADCERLVSSLRDGKASATPFSLLAIPSTANDQLQCAKLWVGNKYSAFESQVWRGRIYDHDRIRIAYVSADFREHPISHLMAGLFECHDRSRFDITGVSLGPDDGSQLRRRVQTAFEHFIEAKDHGDDRIGALITSLEIDILVDLMGFTDGSRMGIFARRPAPIQVSYLGYAGTLGSSFIDYVIGDEIVIPESHRQFYSEKIVCLPNSFLVNDRARSIAEKAITRGEAGLPLSGFVFCCFNNSYKFTPSTFDVWMRILKEVPGSVLWLAENNEDAANNLRKEAAARGVAIQRLIFAKRVPLAAEHLARLRLADLFLDTRPYNAHATASDALWAGVPVLTCLGETFAGRVAASLLTAMRVPELITTTVAAYEKTAIDLARNPERLAKIKHKIAENRLASPLFDTERFSNDIEAAYAAIYERHRTGMPPDHIVVQN